MWSNTKYIIYNIYKGTFGPQEFNYLVGIFMDTHHYYVKLYKTKTK